MKKANERPSFNSTASTFKTSAPVHQAPITKREATVGTSIDSDSKLLTEEIIDRTVFKIKPEPLIYSRFGLFVEKTGKILWNPDNRLTKYFLRMMYNKANHFREVILSRY